MFPGALSDIGNAHALSRWAATCHARVSSPKSGLSKTLVDTEDRSVLALSPAVGWRSPLAGASSGRKIADSESAAATVELRPGPQSRARSALGASKGGAAE